MGKNANIDYFHVIVLPLQAQKGIKIPSSKYFYHWGLQFADIHIYSIHLFVIAVYVYVKIDKAKVFLNWVQKTKPPYLGTFKIL